MAEAPGVARRPAIDGRFGRGTDAAFGAGGAPPGHDAGGADAVIDRAVAVITGIGQQSRAIMRRKINGFAAKVFQQEGHPREGAARQASGDGAAGDILLRQDHGVQLWVQFGSSLQRSIQQFRG